MSVTNKEKKEAVRMTKEMCWHKINEHNKSIDNFINNELAIQLDAIDGKINVNQWFQAQTILASQHFYEKGHKIQIELRANGYDIKMDMQSNKLHYFGELR